MKHMYFEDKKGKNEIMVSPSDAGYTLLYRAMTDMIRKGSIEAGVICSGIRIPLSYSLN